MIKRRGFCSSENSKVTIFEKVKLALVAKKDVSIGTISKCFEDGRCIEIV